MAGAGAVRAGEAYIEIGTRVGRKFQMGLAAIGKRLVAFSARLAKRVVLVAAAATAAAITLSIRAFAKFQEQMAQVATMLDKTTMPMLKGLTRELRRMAVTFGESTQALSKGLYDILSASIPAKHAMDVLRISVMAAKAGITDAGVAADAVTTMINAYGLSAAKAADISDWLFAIVKRGKTTFAELAPSIGLVATDASIAGLSMEEFGAALATMTRAGIRTENAVTRLRAIVNTFLKPEEQGAKAARKLGFELNTQTLRTIGLRGVLEKLSKARAEDVAAIFRQRRALSGMNALIGSGTGFIKDYGLMFNRAGRTQEAFAKTTAILVFEWRRMKQAVVDIGLAIGKHFAEPLRNILKLNIIPWLERVSKFFDKFGSRIAAVAEKLWNFVGTVLGPVWDKFMELAKSGVFDTWINNIRWGIAGIGIAIQTLGNDIDALAARMARMSARLTWGKTKSDLLADARKLELRAAMGRAKVFARTLGMATMRTTFFEDLAKAWEAVSKPKKPSILRGFKKIGEMVAEGMIGRLQMLKDRIGKVFGETIGQKTAAWMYAGMISKRALSGATGAQLALAGPALGRRMEKGPATEGTLREAVTVLRQIGLQFIKGIPGVSVD